MTIIEGLAKLAEQRSDMCKQIPGTSRYVVGGYAFWLDLDNRLNAQLGGVTVWNEPALDWLQCALQRVAIAKGYDYQLSAWNGPEVSHIADLWTYDENIQRAGGSPAETLLEALTK